MGYLALLLGLAFFIAPHVAGASSGPRQSLALRLGEGPYKLVFTALALLGIVLIAYGFGLYRRTEWLDLWSPPPWTRHLAVGLMWPATILVVAAYMPGHIKHRLKHPMLAGVKLWAAAHLLANGDLGSVLLFGGILLWAAWTRVALKRREVANAHGADVAPGGWGNDVGAVLVGTLVYLALGFVFHPLLIGVPAFAG